MSLTMPDNCHKVTKYQSRVRSMHGRDPNLHVNDDPSAVSATEDRAEALHARPLLPLPTGFESRIEAC